MVAVAALLAVGAALVIALGADDPALRHAPASPPVVAPRRVLAGPPAMALACPVPNSIACDRVALLVNTRRPARAVTVTIGDRSAVLDDLQWSEPWQHGVKRRFSGFLQPAGMLDDGPLHVTPEDGRDRYTGRNAVSAPVRVVITRTDGSRVATSLRLELFAGWG